MTMGSLNFSQRLRIAERLLGLKDEIALAVTREFFERHPDWLARYGERGWKLGVEDAGYHVAFLASAIESGQAASFANYAAWAAGMLQSRGIDVNFLRENLEQIGRALQEKFSGAEYQAIAPFLQAGVEECKPPAAVKASGDKECPADLTRSRSVFLQAILHGERNAASTVAMELLRTGRPIEEIYLDVLQPALYEIGRMWELSQITVAQEHMATAVVQYVMAQLYPLIPFSHARRGKAIITGVEKEMHQVGANMVADILEMDGWDVRFLGVNVPHSGIIQAIREHQADLLGISATMLLHLPQVRDLIGKVREELREAAPRIIVGGAAFRTAPDLWSEIGADAYASDLGSALEITRQWK